MFTLNLVFNSVPFASILTALERLETKEAKVGEKLHEMSEKILKWDSELVNQERHQVELRR